MKKLLRTAALVLTLLFMLLTYASGTILLWLGCGYGVARLRNSGSVNNVTETYQFRRIVRENMDELYRVVTTGKAPENMAEGVAYFAYGMDANILCSSDSEVTDIPSFEEMYQPGDTFIYFVRYTAGTYRGASTANGRSEAFVYDYAEAVDKVLDGEMRDYANTALMLAVRIPKRTGFDGLRGAKLEYYLLRYGPLMLLVVLGGFLFSLAIVLFNSRRRRRVDRRLADAVAWLYVEIKLAALAAVVWLCVKYCVFPPDYRTPLILALCLFPVAYILRCNVQYHGGGAFFRRSLIADFVRAIRRAFDQILPLTELQRDAKTHGIRLAVFGLVIPAVLFIAVDQLIGARALRLLIPFYIVYFAVLFFLFYRKFAKLVNGVAELERFSALLPEGGRPPKSELTEDEILAPLAERLTEVDEAVEARADQKFRQTHKKLALISVTIGDLREQLHTLTNQTADQPELQPELRQLNRMAEDLFDTVMQTMPVAAPVLKRMDLSALVTEVGSAHLAELSAAQLALNSELPEEPVFITADAGQIRMVLNIFFGNAAMYAAAGSTLEVRILPEPGQWRFVMVNSIAESTGGASGSGSFSCDLGMAREYIAINGGILEQTVSGSRFAVSFALPAAH